MPLLFMLRLTLALQSNASERNAKGTERAGGEHPATGGGDSGEGPVGQGRPGRMEL